MEILTGYKGTPHITSAQDRFKNQGIVGADSYVFDLGGQFAATITSATKIRISDGILCHQGCVACIEKGDYETLTIANGSQGTYRKDLIVARYTKDGSTNVENMSLVVITGVSTSGTPVTPSYYSGDIQAGDSPVDMPLYEIYLNGISISSITSRKVTVASIKELDALCTDLEDNKLDVTGDSRGNSVTYSSGDSSTPTQWTDFDVLRSGETHASIMAKLSTAAKNLRYIWSLIGASSFSNLASTITLALGNNALATSSKNLSGAVNELNGRTTVSAKAFRMATSDALSADVKAGSVGANGYIYGTVVGLRALGAGSYIHIGSVYGFGTLPEIYFWGRLKVGATTPGPNTSGSTPEEIGGYPTLMRMQAGGSISLWLPVALESSRVNCLTFELSFPIGL